MIDHVSTYAKNFDATQSFYRAALAPLGFTIQQEMVATWDADFPTRRACAFGPPGMSTFWVIETKQDVTPRHTAFEATTRASVTAFYDAALAAGGRDNGEPGLRPIYHEHYYAAFVFDPDGNDVEAVCHTRK